MNKKFNNDMMCRLLSQINDKLLEQFSEIEKGEVMSYTDKIITKYIMTDDNCAFFVVGYVDVAKSYDYDINETGYAIQFLIQDYDEPDDDNIVMQEYLVLLDERCVNKRFDDFIWYCVNFDNKYPGSKSGKTYKRKHLSLLETKFMTSYRDILQNVSDEVFKELESEETKNIVSISHYNYYTEMTRKNGVPAPKLPKYKEIIEEFNNTPSDTPDESVNSQKKGDDNYIKMDGEFHQFEGGAIRYTKTGKGRFDLIPWIQLEKVLYYGSYTHDYAGNDEVNYTEHDIISFVISHIPEEVIRSITSVKYGNGKFTPKAIAAMLRDLAIHYEKGAEKYGVDNWKKGVPLSSFWDSGARHTCQYLLGLEDEPHWISAIWNMLGYLWVEDNE